MEDLTSVNADQVGDEGLQTEQVPTEPVNAGQQEVATPQEDKPVQDAQTNAQFAAVRRQAEKEARDNVIKEMYGDQGINSYEEYQQALRAQQEAQERQAYLDRGIDPDAINSLVANHPDVQFAKELKAKQEAEAKFDTEANELFVEFPDLDAKTIQPEVFQMREQKGISLLDAYLRVNAKNFRSQAEQEAIRKLSANAQSTPGALGQSGNAPNNSISNMSNTDFKALQERVMRGEKVQI